jgi:hypothetical protein
MFSHWNHEFNDFFEIWLSELNRHDVKRKEMHIKRFSTHMWWKFIENKKIKETKIKRVCYNDRRFLKEKWSTIIENNIIDKDNKFLNHLQFFQSLETFFIFKRREIQINTHHNQVIWSFWIAWRYNDETSTYFCDSKYD